MQIRPEGDELFHADGWRDTTKLAVAFRNFPNGPKNGKKHANNFVPFPITVVTLQCFTQTHTILVSSYALASVFGTI